MTKMKKLMSLLLAAVMMLSLVTVNAFADGEGTITVENATVGEDYTVYKMFSMTKVGDAYAYIVEDEWEDFFTGDYANLIDSKGQAIADEFNKISSLSAFAGVAAQWAKNNVSEFDEKNNVTDTTLEFDGLDMGYYLVTSTFSGGLCMLTNADPDAEIVDKNFLPAIAKGVDEDDSNDDPEFVLNNDAYIGQEVEFQIVITSDAAPEDYVVTDTLEDGCWDTTGTANSVVVKYVPKTGSEETLGAGDYVVYVDDNVITIEFENNSLTTVKAYDELVITYTAKLSGDADVSDEDDQDPNTNKAVLDYTDKVTGAGGETRESAVTNTYTWEIPVFKFETVDGDEEALEGAKFVLQNEDEEYYAVDANGVVSWVDDIDDATELESDDEGNLVFTGVDTGEYVLIETEAPAGYNMAADTKFETSFTISESGVVSYDDGDLEVENSTGTILPETGGIGTLIFRVGGAALIIVAAVMLVAKKRTNNM